VRSGENVLTVVEAVKKKIAALSASFPPGVTLEVAYDRTDLIRRAIDTLRRTLIEEMIVVALVIVVFLFHFRSALVPITVLPIAIAISFLPMYLFGISSNIMSLGGLALAVGVLVDALGDQGGRQLGGAALKGGEGNFSEQGNRIVMELLPPGGIQIKKQAVRVVVPAPPQITG
jgi:hypothetical protein